MLPNRSVAAALATMLGAAALWVHALKPAPITTIPDRSTMTEYPGP